MPKNNGFIHSVTIDLFGEFKADLETETIIYFTKKYFLNPH